jgi:hypothetical protein
MKHTTLLALSCAGLAALGCSKKKEDDAAGAAPATGSGSSPAGRLEPFTGKLTADRVLRARDQVKPFDPWDAGFAKLQALLGAPTRVDGTRHVWAVVEGDACAYFHVSRDNGADYNMDGIIIGTVQQPMQTTKGAGPVGNHHECLKLAGVQLGPPEDPDAPGPPADGSPVPLADVRTHVVPGRSKWKDQPVKVAATLGGVSTSTSGGDRFVTVSLVAGPGDRGEALSCSLEKNAPAPELKQGTAVIAAGTMKIDEWTSMGTGDVKLRPKLASCTIAAAPGK